MLRKTICACVLVLAGLLLMGCSRQNESKKPQAEQTNESNILDHFVIEKRDDSAQEEERISMSLDDLKKHPKKEKPSKQPNPASLVSKPGAQTVVPTHSAQNAQPSDTAGLNNRTSSDDR